MSAEITVWRITKEAFRNSIWTGQGASICPGRWQSQGTPVVYCSEALSLAAWELFVHIGCDALDVDAPHKFYTEELVRGALRLKLDINNPNDDICVPTLSTSWRTQLAETRQIGDDWCRDQETPIMKVPSAVIDGEYNYLLNPNHPRFSEVAPLEAASLIPFEFDVRLMDAISIARNALLISQQGNA